jgi:type III restriction enzyme
MPKTTELKTLELYLPQALRGDIEGWRNMGWVGVTGTTEELLKYWFEEVKEDGIEFHLCQQMAIETIIYCHEILGIRNPYQLYTDFGTPEHPNIARAARSKRLQDELNPITFPKYCLKMATGSGKTWVLNALIVWQYFNALNGEIVRNQSGDRLPAPVGYSQRFLIVTPGKEVQKRILESVEKDWQRPLFMPPGSRWRDRFYLEKYTPNDFRDNLTLTDGPFLMVTNWQQFRFAKDDPSLWEEFMGEREETPKAEIIADLLTEYPDLCILNDEAHHVHAAKRPNPTTQKDEELIWRRFMSFLNQEQQERHPNGDRVFTQIDFSATPFFGTGDNKDYFPHIVYDYSLAQASVDMLVKQLFLEQRQGSNLADLDFKAERAEPEGNRRRGEILDLSRGQKVMLEIGKSKLEQLTQEFKESGINRKPVMLVLAEETEVADMVGDYFNTLVDSEGSPYDGDRVVVYHSNLKTQENKQAEEKLDDIDDDNKPLQIVVSVLSVREGFDRTNICIIVMLRASEADLLLEQIVGRGLRLMFPPYNSEYEQIQDAKQEAREKLMRQEAPGNAFDCLFLVEHPKFRDFYEDYLRRQGYAVGSGDSSATKAVGDLITVDAEGDRLEKYDIYWPAQFYDQSPVPNLNEIDVDKLGHYPVQFSVQKSITAKTMITDVHVETETKAKTWILESDFFDYNFYLQNITRSITRTRKTQHLTSHAAEIAALVDEYTTRRLFTETIDFMEAENYQVLQSQQIVDFVTNQLRAAIAEAMGEIQFQPGAVWRRLSDVNRLMMRQANMVQTPRCIYPYQAIQSNKGGLERKIITKLLNLSPEVLAFAKLDRKHDLIIPWRDNRGIQRKYEPDFLVKTENTMFLFEAKGDHLITHSDTALKAQAAMAWCLSASRVAPPNGVSQPQQWEYIILKESVFNANEGASFNALLALMRQEAVALTAGLYGELGLQF